MKLSLTSKFSIAAIITLALVLSIGGIFFARVQKNDLLANMKTNSANLSRMAADSVSSLVTEIEYERTNLQSLALDLARLPGVEQVAIFDSAGLLLANTLGNGAGQNDNAAIQQVLQSGKSHQNEDRQGSQLQYIPVTAPEHGGVVIGVLALKTAATRSPREIDNLTRVVHNAIAQQLSHMQTEQNDLARLLEIIGKLESVDVIEIYQEQLMLTHGGKLRQGGVSQAVSSARVKEVFRTGRQADHLDLTAGSYQLYTPIFRNNLDRGELVGVVRISMNLHQVSTMIDELRNELLITGLGLAAALLLMLVGMVRKVMILPLRELGEASRAIGSGDFEREIQLDSRDELGELGKTFATMTSALKESRQQLKASYDEMERRVIHRTAELYSEKERLHVTLRSIGDGVISTDAEGLVEYLNPAAEYMTGWRNPDAEGRPLGEIFHLVDELSRETLPDILAASRRGKASNEYDRHAMLINQEGKEIAIESSVSAMRDDTGAIRGSVVIFRDVGVERRLQRQLQYQANHDALTGLQNRRMFEESLERTVANAHALGTTNVMLFLDLDQFKVVNDTCGHMAGDALLTQLTSLLRDKMRGSDILARLGGDEFGVILQDCRLAQGQRIAEVLLNTVREFRFIWDGKGFELGVSIGMVIVDNSISSATAVMSAADVACYAAKDSGRNRIHLYQADDDDLSRREGEMQWVSLLSKALQEHQFRLYHQLITPLQTDDSIHCEILLRLQDENGALIPPGAFIPAAERYNLMTNIDRWVIREVFAHYARYWSTRSLKPHQIAINLSGTSINDPKLYDYIVGQLHEFGLNGAPFCFEITETAAVANLTRASELINKLKAHGCRFALDDFGCGVSSFGYLKNLPVDYLKIDGGFVRDMTHDRVDYAMVEAIHRIGHVMGLKTIAEYVEDEAIMTALTQLGVDFGQGYHIARPAPLETFDALIARRNSA